MSAVTGRDYWSDREGVFFEYLRRKKINLVPQWYFPGDAQKNIEEGQTMHEHNPGGWDNVGDTDATVMALCDQWWIPDKSDINKSRYLFLPLYLDSKSGTVKMEYREQWDPLG